MRPETLLEVVDQTTTDGDWRHHLHGFLDHFYEAHGWVAAQRAMIDPEPELTGDARVDAMIGGVGEHLARRWDLPIPAWVRSPERYLDRPFFYPDGKKIRPMLIVASPIAFRTRLIFTGPDPLDRARFPRHVPKVTMPDPRPS